MKREHGEYIVFLIVIAVLIALALLASSIGIIHIGNIFFLSTNKAENITVKSLFHRFPPSKKTPFILYQSSKIRSRFL